MATFRIGKVVLKSLFKKPATLMYPVVPREWQERTRGQIGIRKEDCIVCGICAKKCPANAITVDRNKRTWTIERMQCIQCNCCVEVCPKTCLTMENQYTEPGTEKVVHTFEIPKQDKPALNKADNAESSGGDALTCNLDECVYCGLCAKNCPCDALTVDRKEKIWKVDQDACASCGACIDKCPKKCLALGGGEAAPADSKDQAEKPAEPEVKEPVYSCPEDEEGLRCKTSDCIYCGLCAKICPAEALTIERKEKVWSVDKDACVTCGACVNQCPKECLEMID
ncbi:4Fe-4S binding protein [bacterium 210820-DFI.6.37]|nr:4Fe-4S binding protein [bacterium 210820-DFI.6.37]